MSDQQFQPKQKKSKQGNPFVPLFGFIALIVFGAFSWFAAPSLRGLIEKNSDFVFPTNWPEWAPNAVLAFVIFIILFAVIMALSAAFGGSTMSASDEYSLKAAKSKKKGRRRR